MRTVTHIGIAFFRRCLAICGELHRALAWPRTQHPPRRRPGLLASSCATSSRNPHPAVPRQSVRRPSFHRNSRAMWLGKRQLQWAPRQIAGWLKRIHPDNEALQVSHETIDKTLCRSVNGRQKPGTAPLLAIGKEIFCSVATVVRSPPSSSAIPVTCCW